MKVVIFAGGVGSRLWPLSRKNTPKQFEKIVEDKSTLQLALDRISTIIKPEDTFISSGARYKDILYQQLPQIPKENIILEPEMRDVGPAVGLVTGILDKIAPDEPFIILWSDHLVKNVEVFRNALLTIEEILKKEKNKIVFMGQTSRFGSQNLGWIEFGRQMDTINNFPIFSFKSFHYRPEPSKAEEFHISPYHAWNPGYFGTTPSFLFSLYKKFSPEMHKMLEEIRDAWGTPEYDQVLSEVFPKMEKVSFDNVILEKIEEKDAYVMNVDLGWSDIGAWESLKEALAGNPEDNVIRGKVLLNDSKDSLVFNYCDQMVVGIDLDQILVINTEDVLLICPKNSVPKIKKLVESLAGTEHESLT